MSPSSPGGFVKYQTEYICKNKGRGRGCWLIFSLLSGIGNNRLKRRFSAYSKRPLPVQTWIFQRETNVYLYTWCRICVTHLTRYVTMLFSMLHCTSLCYNVVIYLTMYFSVIQGSSPCYSVLLLFTMYFPMLKCTSPRVSTIELFFLFLFQDSKLCQSYKGQAILPPPLRAKTYHPTPPFFRFHFLDFFGAKMRWKKRVNTTQQPCHLLIFIWL